MVRVRLIALSLSGLVTLVLAGTALAAGTSVRISESNNVYHFGPAKVFVNVGGRVTWSNGSDAPHTVTSDSGTELSSPTLGAGATFSHTFSATGTFTYHCSIHTYMKGTVVVLAAGATLPPTDAVASPSTATQAPTVAGVALIALLAGSLGAGLYLRRRRA